MPPKDPVRVRMLHDLGTTLLPGTGTRQFAYMLRWGCASPQPESRRAATPWIDPLPGVREAANRWSVREAMAILRFRGTHVPKEVSQLRAMQAQASWAEGPQGP